MDSFKKSNSILDGGSSEFNESEHPRDEDGKFTNKGQTGVFKKSADLMDASNSEGLTTEPKKHKIKGQKAKLLALKNKPDGTYDLETGEAVSYESGYQVSFQQTGDTYTDAEYDDKVAEMIKRTGSRAHAVYMQAYLRYLFIRTTLTKPCALLWSTTKKACLIGRRRDVATGTMP